MIVPHDLKQTPEASPVIPKKTIQYEQSLDVAGSPNLNAAKRLDKSLIVSDTTDQDNETIRRTFRTIRPLQ